MFEDDVLVIVLVVVIALAFELEVGGGMLMNKEGQQ